ncbi:MAG: hypothetical protein U9N11_08155, partial [Campylobacterota bacterium]|nr:hypothetical protein [Campylobacterota bacterium]
ILSLFKLEIFITFQIFSFLLAMMILWKSWQIVLEHNGYDKSYGMYIFLVLVLLYPAFLLYIPIPLREFFILLGFSILVYGLVNKYYTNKGSVTIILGAILLIMGRPQFMVIVVLFAAMFQKNMYLKYGSLLISIILIPLLYSMVFSYKFTPEYFSYLRGELIDTYELLSYGRVEWHSYLDVLKDIPLLTLQFLLSPFAILHTHNPLSFLSIFVDALFSIVVYVSAIYAGFKVSKIYLLIFIVSAILFSVWEFYIPGAARHRMPLVAMLLPVASFGILKAYYVVKAKL